ncbi:hypothetical protein [Salinarimonas ramus]|uniref:Uncharacterized protein n=1 Tax=Salinarimonas ramus TaxID=690164 RepID=A0A917QE18_9HYPH|nr:hypothetical protein [Salinarimonas ramus]GGK46130.1 hypothetical protein GCM10011322_36520 [Salinarimonas ramus]
MPFHQHHPLPAGRLHDLIVAIDGLDAGFLGFVLRLSNGRQQAAFAVLSRHLPPIRERKPSLDHLTSVLPFAADVRRLHPRDLIEKHLGSCPDGFVGALAKTKRGPQGSAYYARLHRALSDPASEEVAKVIRQADWLDHHRLDALLTLDPVFLCPRFALKVRCRNHAEDLNTALRLFKANVPGVTESDLRASVQASINGPSRWVLRWLRRAVVPVPDFAFALPTCWKPLNSGSALYSAGTRNRVCLSEPQALFPVLQRRKLYFEDRSRSLIAEVRVVGKKSVYILAGVHGPKNGLVKQSIRDEVGRDFASSAGIYAWDHEPPSAWDAVERLVCGLASLEDELDELDALDVDPFDGMTEEPELDLTPAATTETA